MTRNVSIALKNGRVMSQMKKEDAAERLGVDGRTLSRYETINPRDSVKQEDPALIANMIKLYDDSLIGMIYLSEHPVYIEMKNRILDLYGGMQKPVA